MVCINYIIFTCLLCFSMSEAGEIAVTVDKFRPKREDQYVCSDAFEIEEPNIYITGFVPKTEQNKIHHFFIFSIK